MKPKLAAICNECNAELNEGQSAFYDHSRGEHYCDKKCFRDWFVDNAELIGIKYSKENCERVDL